MEFLNLKERYPFTCECGHECEAGPSIFQAGFQLNTGRVRCPKCKKGFSVKIDDKNERMEIVDDSERERGKLEINRLPDSCYRQATPEEVEKFSSSPDRLRVK